MTRVKSELLAIMVEKGKWNIHGSAAMFLGLFLGLFLFAFNVIGFGFEYFPGDLGDGRLNLYFLEHAHRFFSGKVSSFWNAPFMHPEPNVITYSDNLLGSAPIYSLFRIVGFDTYRAYQLWYLALTALNYLMAFVFLKHLFKNHYAAVLGAFVFAFSMALQSQLTHAQTFPRYAIPLAFLMAVKYSENLRQSKYLLFALLSVVYQIYCGVYLGFMLVVPVGAFLVLVVTRDVLGEKRITYNLKWFAQVGGSLLISVALLLPLMIPYMGRKISPSFDHFMHISGSIPSPQCHFFSQEGSLFWDFLSGIGKGHGAWWDHQIFAGGVATICLFLSVLWLLLELIGKRFRLTGVSTALMLTLTAVVTFLLFMRFDDFSAYLFLYYIPGFSSMRSLTRVINIELIFFAVSVALVYIRCIDKREKYQVALFMVILTLLVCDNYFYENKTYRREVTIAKERTARVENAFAQIPTGSVVSYEPLAREPSANDYQLDAMLISQKYGLTVLNGYTATCPGDFGGYWREPNEESRNHWLADKSISQDTLYVVKGRDSIEVVVR